MQRYVARRLLLLIPTMFGITFFVFVAVRFVPGGVVDQLLGEYWEYGRPPPELRGQLEERYSLNQPIHTQYIQWLGEIVRGNLGTSITSTQPVLNDLKFRLPVTIQLGVMALIISTVIAVPVGVLSALRQDTLPDYLGRSLAITLLALPNFWLALLVITYGFIWFGWTPPLKYHQLWDDPVQNIKILWVPVFLLGSAMSASVMRYTRSTMLEVLRQDYIRTAWSKGLRERVIVIRHALRNSLIPVITIIGLQVSGIVGGTVILEQIFSLPGMGSYLISMIGQRDYPVIQAIVLISAMAVVVSILVVDLSYSLLDPRIRYK